MSLIGLLVFVLVLFLILFLIRFAGSKLGIDGATINVFLVIVVVIAILWLLQGFGVFSSGPIFTRR